MTALDDRPRTGRPGRRPTPANPHWSDHGACNGMDPELWFPHSGEAVKIREAKGICADCPVWTECRQDGIDGGIYRAGIWGGLTETDRARLRRPAKPKPEPGPADPDFARALYAAGRKRYSTDDNAITAIANRLKLPRPTVAAWIRDPTATAAVQGPAGVGTLPGTDTTP